MLWACLALPVLLALHQPGAQALPLAASALSQPAQGATNSSEIEALMVIANTLFQSQAQQIAYGWLLNIDPCGFETCRPKVQPSCSWTGLSCTNWHVTGILLDPTRVIQPGVPAQLKGTISPYIVLLQQLQSLQLGNQGITGTLPRVLGLLSNLTTLDLSSNQMTGFLPTTWGLLSNLTTLTLFNNSLEGSVPSSWTGLTSLNALCQTQVPASSVVVYASGCKALLFQLLQEPDGNPGLCNTIPNITALSPASFANSALDFPACNASVLAAQAASNTSPASPSSPSASPASSPSPEAGSAPSAGSYHTSPGINVSVSVLVGLCFLLGILAGLVRIRQQQRRHRQLLIGLNQQRRDIAQLRADAPAFGTAQFDAFAAATTPFCSTPRLVLGPDGNHLALARKLKQQNADARSGIDGSSAEGTGQGSASTSLSNTVNIPARFSYQPQTKLYTAYLEVDSREAQNAPMPVDLVSPIPTSKAESNRADGAVQHQPTALQVETRQPSMAGGNMLGRVSQSLSRLSAQSLPPEPNQDPDWQSHQRSSSLMQQREDVGASQGAQQQPRSEQQGSGQQQQRSWWPFRRAMQ
ncbi:TPA: hypothetical protein ACH3X2_011244 [Trebouxia sp. C0005]